MSQATSANSMVVPWGHLVVDGCRAASHLVFVPGMRLRLGGSPLRVPGPSFCLSRAVAVAVRALGAADRFCDGLTRDDPLVEQDIVLTDGTSVFRAAVVRTFELSRPLLVLRDPVPPGVGTLWVTTPDAVAGAASAPDATPVRLRTATAAR